MREGSRGNILIVEDEPKLSRLLEDYLAAAGYGAATVNDGRAAVPSFKANRYDLVLLDLMLPGRDGLDICRELRSFSKVPIIMVTARVEEIDRLLGLELGADDYICKPFSPREVVARVRAVLRRTEHNHEIEPLALRIDESQLRAWLGGKPLELTPVEFRLLRTLASAPGRVFSRQHLLDNLYEDNRVVTDRTVDSHVKNLRRKMQHTCPGTDFIESIYGVGYRFEEPSSIET